MKKLLLLVAFAVMICSAAFAGWDKTFALSDKVEHKKVNFYNRLGINISADVYMPKSRLENKKLPAIVVGAPWGAVKEQAAGLYAEKLAEQGFITLA
ncbi:MAG: alpha/beta hydrolase, partial [Alphaproteobacteria bacterium]|nr:alpha/beta hydrolase [Alphaproteobacteria bacterium]